MTRPRTATVGGIVIVSAILLALAAGVRNQAGGGVDPSNSEAAVSQIFEQLAGSANALKGAEVEADVFFEGATVDDSETLTYTYTVAGVADRPFDGEIARMARDRLKHDSCADIVLRNAIDRGGAVRYVYLSSGGTRILVIDLDSRSCLQSP